MDNNVFHVHKKLMYTSLSSEEILIEPKLHVFYMFQRTQSLCLFLLLSLSFLSSLLPFPSLSLSFSLFEIHLGNCLLERW